MNEADDKLPESVYQSVLSKTRAERYRKQRQKELETWQLLIQATFDHTEPRGHVSFEGGTTPHNSAWTVTFGPMSIADVFKLAERLNQSPHPVTRLKLRHEDEHAENDRMLE